MFKLQYTFHERRPDGTSQTNLDRCLHSLFLIKIINEETKEVDDLKNSRQCQVLKQNNYLFSPTTTFFTITLVFIANAVSELDDQKNVYLV